MRPNLSLAMLLVVGCALPGTSPDEPVCAVPEPGEVCTLAGVGIQGSRNEAAPAAETWLNLPTYVSFDPTGRPILADFNNHRIRLLRDDGWFETLAGTGAHTYGGPDGVLATSSGLENPNDAEMAADGTLYLTELHGSRIMKVDPSGILTTHAGDAYSPGYIGYSGDGGPALAAELNEPVGLALDDEGNVWFTDTGNHCIRYVDPDGIIHTLAGGHEGLVDGIGPLASFQHPAGLTWADGYLYVADEYNNAVRKIDTTTGEVVTIAGTGIPGFAGDGGLAVEAMLDGPRGAGVGPDGSVYIADSNNYVIRRVTPDGTIDTVLGEPHTRGFSDGLVEDVLLDWPNDASVSPGGDLYLVDTFNQRLRIAPGLALE